MITEEMINEAERLKKAGFEWGEIRHALEDKFSVQVKNIAPVARAVIARNPKWRKPKPETAERREKKKKEPSRQPQFTVTFTKDGYSFDCDGILKTSDNKKVTIDLSESHLGEMVVPWTLISGVIIGK